MKLKSSGRAPVGSGAAIPDVFRVEAREKGLSESENGVRVWRVGGQAIERRGVKLVADQNGIVRAVRRECIDIGDNTIADHRGLVGSIGRKRLTEGR